MGKSISRKLSARKKEGICVIVILFIWVVPLRLWPLNFWPGSNRGFEIYRYSNHTDGIAPILHIEGVNVLEEARGIESEENEYINSSYITVIDNATIDYYNSQHDGNGLYLAYSWSLENLNFSENVISEILEDIKLVDEYLYNRLDSYRPNWRLDHWTTSQDISLIHLISGWFIFQRLEYGIVRSPLDGEGFYLTQISIIDTNMDLLWIASSIINWIA
ncbi:MAG: hypothetical protein AM325_016275 [Candidatus Thorarchaeota archaeon SMTZ1-45]